MSLFGRTNSSWSFSCCSMSTPPLRRRPPWRRTAVFADLSRLERELEPGTLRGPIANSRHVSARPRRRQVPSVLFRTALACALVATLALAIPRVIDAFRQPDGNGSVTRPTGSQPALAGLEAGACMSFAPTHGRPNKTVFVDARHGGPDPGGVGTSTSGRPR